MTPTGRRQPVGYLQAWPRIWSRDNREQMHQVTRARLEPGAAGLRVRSADLSAMLLTFDLYLFFEETRIDNRERAWPQPSAELNWTIRCFALPRLLLAFLLSSRLNQCLLFFFRVLRSYPIPGSLPSPLPALSPSDLVYWLRKKI